MRYVKQTQLKSQEDFLPIIMVSKLGYLLSHSVRSFWQGNNLVR